MQFRKLTIDKIEKDVIYVAYSAKNKHLSANGNAGVFVKLEEKTTSSLKVRVLGTDVVTAIARLEERDDCYIYDPSGCPIPLRVVCEDFSEWPTFTQRMQNQGLNGTVFELDSSEIMDNTREGPGQGVTVVRHKGGSKHPTTGEEILDNYRINWLRPVEAPEWRIPRAQRMGMGTGGLPLPPKPVKPEHEEVIKALMPVLKSVKAHSSNNVSFAQVSADFKEKAVYKHEACHRNLQRDPDFAVAYVVSLGSNKSDASWVKGHPSAEAQRLYITYLTSYSPYADAFITKDVDFILENGYVLDGNAPNRIIAGALFATRQEWEKPFRAEGFLALYKEGVNLDAAFLFGCQCSQFGGGKIKFAMTDGDHNHLQHGRLSDKCMINFITHKPELAGKPYIKDVHASSGGHGIDGMWSKSFDSGRSDIYNKLASIKRQQAGAGFADNSMPVDEAVEMAADYIDDWLGTRGL